MSLTENDIRLIDGYLDNDLSEEERSLFESKLSDEDFLNNFMLRKDVAEGVANHHAHLLKNELKDLLVNKKEENARIPFSETPPRRIRYLSIAASISILVFVSYFVVNQKSTLTSDELFQAYYKPFPVGLTTRGDQEEQHDEALRRYSEGKYKEVIDIFENQELAGGKGASMVLDDLILGNCYLQTNQPGKALLTFSKVRGSKDIILSQHGSWFYALALVKEDKISEAVPVIDELITSRSIYHTQASNLKQHLSN